MGRLDGVSKMKLDLPRLCADFYLLEMATVHVPNGPAATMFERYQKDVAPKIALTLEFSISTELGFAKGIKSQSPMEAHEGYPCPLGCDEDDWSLEVCGDFYGNCDVKHNFLSCGCCGAHFLPGETIAPNGKNSKYAQSVHYFCKKGPYADCVMRYNQTYEKFGPQLHADAADAFHKGIWTPGYGGKKWGTIADVVRDYHNGTIKPRTFLDRAWTLQHNNASVFDKIYSTSELMHVLEIQASNDYKKLADFASIYAGNLWQRMERWVDVYTVDTSYGRRVPEWIGTGD